MSQRPLSNGFTALSICMVIVFGYFTFFEVLPVSLGFTLTLGSIILLIGAMSSALPEDTEVSVHKEILDADHLDDDL